ncbi:MAG: efflux RND transporter periplasmic adaptor subunit [Deltaproteobacteria bacterium]|nr:efflux RND transporter periplasmic adaptor subunit [Deltaproteobacteria bacterium]MCB9787435.1 efflux RND transporter periplasmic adaptor subunit [Deltaproteobacteria bacterium]
MRRQTMWVGAALVVAGVGALGAGGCQRQDEGTALPKEPVPVTIATGAAEQEAAKPSGAQASPGAQPGGERAGLAAEPVLTGSSEPHRRSTISANQSGTVRGVHVEEGQTVEAGQVIVTLDTTDFDLRLRQADAAVRAARVQVETAKIEADRARKLLASKAVPERQADLAVAQERAAGAALQQALVVRDMAKRSISEAEMRAPYDAVVVKRHISEGEAATAVPPTAFVTIEQRSPIDVRLEVPSVRLREVTVGTPVRVSFPAIGVSLDGTVTRMVPSVDPRSRAAVAIVELPNADGAIAPGLFAEARLRPVAAAKERDAKVEGGGPKAVEVTP